jgi:hypothetical protein
LLRRYANRDAVLRRDAEIRLKGLLTPLAR